MNIELNTVPLPEFGLPKADVKIPSHTFSSRIAAFENLCTQRGFDAAVVYADREHYANMAYLTNYDPRFEEALLVIKHGKKATLLVGNEGMAYAKASVKVDVDFILYQPLSLLSQPRGESSPLRDVLAAAGLSRGSRVATIGWKYYSDEETEAPATWIEIPFFVVDVMRQMGCTVENASEILMHPKHGMRAKNDVDQLAYFEAAATFSSQSVRDIVKGVRPGMSEYDGIRLAGLNGWPMSMYPILLGGENTRLGLGSPSHRQLKRGDPVVTCIGLWGGNTCRAGFLARDAADLPASIGDYVEKLAIPYFRSAVAWYETIGLGVTGGEVFDAVHTHVGEPFFGVKLNPGHLIHLDEWLSSPISRGSSATLCSGMALQLDIIPSTGTDYWTSNVEDGVALADDDLRREFAAIYPEAWARIQGRRSFMREKLGISLKPEVLPFSNIPCYLAPFWLSPERVFRRC